MPNFPCSRLLWYKPAKYLTARRTYSWKIIGKMQAISVAKVAAISGTGCQLLWAYMDAYTDQAKAAYDIPFSDECMHVVILLIKNRFRMQSSSIMNDCVHYGGCTRVHWLLCLMDVCSVRMQCSLWSGTACVLVDAVTFCNGCLWWGCNTPSNQGQDVYPVSFCSGCRVRMQWTPVV
jgi:hypothetical protein